MILTWGPQACVVSVFSPRRPTACLIGAATFQPHNACMTSGKEQSQVLLSTVAMTWAESRQEWPQRHASSGPLVPACSLPGGLRTAEDSGLHGFFNCSGEVLVCGGFVPCTQSPLTVCSHVSLEGSSLEPSPHHPACSNSHRHQVWEFQLLKASLSRPQFCHHCESFQSGLVTSPRPGRHRHTLFFKYKPS